MKRIQVQFPEPTLGGSLLPVTRSRGLAVPFCPPHTHLHSHAPSNRRHTHTADICALRATVSSFPTAPAPGCHHSPWWLYKCHCLKSPCGVNSQRLSLCIWPLSLSTMSFKPSVSGTTVSPFLLGTVLLLKLEKHKRSYKLIELIGLISFFFFP